GRIGRASAGWLPRVCFDEGQAVVHADRVLIGPRAERASDEMPRHGVERFGDLDVLIAGDLGLTPQRDVVGRRRGRQENRLLLRLEMLAGCTLRATVPTKPILLAAPVHGVRARVLEGRED